MESKQSVPEFIGVDLGGPDVTVTHYYPPIPSVSTLSVGDTVKVRILLYDKTFKVFPGVVTDVNPFQPPSVDVLYLNTLHSDATLDTVSVSDGDENNQVMACQVGDEATAVFKAKKILGKKIERLEKELSQAREDACRVCLMFPTTVLRKDRLDPVM